MDMWMLMPGIVPSVTGAAEPEERPSQPILGELTASHVTPDSVQLEWSVPEGTFDSFTVQYKDAQGQPQVVPVDGGSRTVTVPGLSPSRRYKFNLYGVWGRKRLGPVSTDAVTGEWGRRTIHGSLECWVWSLAGRWAGSMEDPLLVWELGTSLGGLLLGGWVVGRVQAGLKAVREEERKASLEGGSVVVRVLG